MLTIKDFLMHETTFASGLLERASPITFFLPLTYSISKSNFCKNSIHLHCLLLKLGWVDKYLKDLWFVTILSFIFSN